jgi:hypothetical protein
MPLLEKNTVIPLISGNRCFLAAKPRKLGGFAAKMK